MSSPKRLEEITVEDLSQHRWCYFHDDDGGYDSFEWVIPDTHPKFSDNVIQLELATFRFQGGEELKGMFDGSKCFSMDLTGVWYALWYGGMTPTERNKQDLNKALDDLGLCLPVTAIATWSGQSETYNGIRYYDQAGCEVEA